MPAQSAFDLRSTWRSKPNLDSRRRGNDELGVCWSRLGCWLIALTFILPQAVRAADKFTTIYSARVMAQALPWIAEDAGLFKKYNLDHNLVFIASSSIVTAALLGGDPDMTMTGGVGNVIAFVRGSTEIVYIGSAKITSENRAAFLQSTRTAFILFSILCFIGIFASLSRGKIHST